MDNNLQNKTQKIEFELNKIRYKNIPLGSLVAHSVVLLLKLHKSNVSFAQYFRSRLSFIYSIIQLFFFSISPDKSNFNIKRPYLFTLLGNDKRFKEWVYPIIETIGPDKVTLISNIKPTDINKNVFFVKLKHHKIKFTLNDISELIVSLNKSFKILKNLNNELKLSGKVIWIIKFNIFNAMLKVRFYEKMITYSGVKIVLTELDRDTTISAPLIEVAKKINIETYTLIHGSTDPPDLYFPVLADHLLCWGNKHLEQFKNLGESEKKLHIIGNHKVNSKTFKSKIFLQEDSIINLLLVTNIVSTSQRKKYFNDFINTIDMLHNCNGLIKIHPREEIEFYKKILPRKFINRIKFLNNKKFSVMDLSKVTFAICHHSNYTYELIFEGIPVIILDSIDVPLGNGKILIEKANVPVAQNAQELKDIVNEMVNDNAKYQTLIKSLQNFKKYIVSFEGEQSLQKIKKLLKK